MDMNELMCLLGMHEKYESFLDETWNVMPIGKLIDWFLYYAWSDKISMMHFTGEKSEIQWCTLIMEADQKLLDLDGSLLQTIAKTQENLGEMLKIQKRQNDMNHHILQDSICLQKEIKIFLSAIRKVKKSGSMMGHSSNRSIKKCSTDEDSKEIE